MFLILHIAVALLGLVMAGLTALKPSRRRMRAAVVLTSLTLYSGALLVMQTHASLASACLSGVAYLAAIGISVGFGYWRLSRSL